MKPRTSNPPQHLGSQLAALGLAEGPEAVASLNALRSPGYRLTRQSTSLAEKILAKDDAASSIRVFVSLGKEESLGLAAIQLGLALAVYSGKETLIVNASAAHPSLDKAFGKAPVQGLSDLLQSNTDWQDVVVPTEVPGLGFLPFGDFETYDSTSLTAHGLSHLLKDMQSAYPQIVIVAPSLASDEASSLLMCADRVGGIAWAGETTRSQVEELEASCASLGKPLLGLVLSHR